MALNIGIIVLIFALMIGTAKAISRNVLPVVPPFQEMLSWNPNPDRTMEVSFEGVSFRYSILDWKPSPDCQAVTEMVGMEELRWVTNAGFFSHQYLTRSYPMAFKREGEGEWHWMNVRTYKEK